MEKLKQNKYFVGIIVLSTLVLAGIASFTAYKLYQLREKPITPNVPSGEVYAFSCVEYHLLIDTDGIIRISNVSGETQPSQQIDIIIGGESLGSFTVPALDPQTNTEIGGINLPAGDFNWNIDGDIICAGNQSGTLHESESCNPFSVKIASAQTLPTSTPTITGTSGINPTSTPVLPNTPTPTVSENTNNTPASNTPTPTPQQIAQATQLPDTGFGSTTIMVVFLAISTVVGASLIYTKQFSDD